MSNAEIVLLFVFVLFIIFVAYHGLGSYCHLKMEVHNMEEDIERICEKWRKRGRFRGRKTFGNCRIKRKSVASPFGHLCIYHIMVDRFNGGWTTPKGNKNDFIGGNLQGITEKLDYIVEQGANAIMLSPFFETAAYHGYHITDYGKVDPHFGDWQSLQELIDAAHQKGLKVICDFVPNHCHVKNALFSKAKSTPDSPLRDWFLFESDGTKFVSYLNLPDLPKLNLHNEAAVDYMISVAAKLVKRGVDGFRIDHAVGIPFSFLKSFCCRLKAISPDLFIFGEVCPPLAEFAEQLEFKNTQSRMLFQEGKLTQEDMQKEYVGIFDGVLDFVYRDIIIDEIKSGNRILGNSRLRHRLKKHFANYPRNFSLILFLDNHDTNRFMYYCNGDKTLLDEALLFTQGLNHPSCIYYGTEQYMTNTSSVDDGVPYADLWVRDPMDWS